MDWHHDEDCERGCFPGPGSTCGCEVRALRAKNERFRIALQKIARNEVYPELGAYRNVASRALDVL